MLFGWQQERPDHKAAIGDVEAAARVGEAEVHRRLTEVKNGTARWQRCRNTNHNKHLGPYPITLYTGLDAGGTV